METRTSTVTFLPSRRVFLLLIALFFLLLTPFGLRAELEKLDDKTLTSVTGQSGIAFRFQDWQIDNGDAKLHLFEPDANANEFADGRLTIGNVRVYDPGGPISDPWELGDEFGPCESSGPCTDDGHLISGTFSDPFLLQVTGDQNGIVALDFPQPQSAFEAADIGMDLGINGNKLAFIGVTNALWAGGTSFEMAIRPRGGINLGIEIQLDGDGFLRAQTSGSFDGGGGVMEGVFAGRNYSCSPPTVNASCFSGALRYASLDLGLPLQVDFIEGPQRSIVLHRVRQDPAPDATIGINEIKFDYECGTMDGCASESLGTTAVTNLEIEEFKFTGPY